MFSLVTLSGTFTDLIIGDERDTVVDGHSADDEVVLHEASVVIGQVDHQINKTFTDETIKTNTV